MGGVKREERRERAPVKPGYSPEGEVDPDSQSLEQLLLNCEPSGVGSTVCMGETLNTQCIRARGQNSLRVGAAARAGSASS